MLDPFDKESTSLLNRLRRAKTRAEVAIIFERLQDASWRIITWVLLFCGLWLFELPQNLGYSVNISSFLVFCAGALYFIWKDSPRFRFPSQNETERRVEEDSQFRHRPLLLLRDALANPMKSQARFLWIEGRARALRLLGNIRLSIPRPLLAAKDPYALRLGVLLFFGLALLVAGADTPHRLQSGLIPFTFTADHKNSVLLVITPPEYTGLPQITQDNAGHEPLKIPEGSTIKATVRGGWGRPVLTAGKDTIPFRDAGEGNYSIETSAQPGTVLKITQMFLPLASWNYQLIPDMPPVITLKENATILPEGTLQFPLQVKDDYGVKTLTLRMESDESIVQPPLGNPVSESRSVMSAPGQDFALQPVFDLTSHPWAGLPVTIGITVEDDVAHKTSLPPMKMVLPERKFTHPVARQLIALRKKLAWAPLDDYKKMSEEIETLVIHPENFKYDITVFLTLQAASSRLYWAQPSKETAESLIALLWDIALKIDDADLSLAARHLRDAQQALEKALQNPQTSQEEIARLMQNLQDAMAEYFQQAQREIQKQIAQGNTVPFVPPEMLAQMIDPQALAEFMQQMESQLMNGDRKSAQQMLSQLQQLMDSLNPSSMAPPPKDMQMMMKGLQELQQLLQRQEALLQQTRDQAESLQGNTISRDFGEALPLDEKLFKKWKLEDMPPPPEAAPRTEHSVIDTSANQAEQEALRFILGQLMREAGEALEEIPPNLGMAEQDMRGSSKELGENRPDLSIPFQELAIQHLKETQKQMSQQLMARMKQMTGFSLGGMRYDPLGRPMGDGNGEGLFGGSRVKIPDEEERKQAKEILRLLRRRSGELDRPVEELDYYRRLLRQF
ncbi:MAG: DUF4175 family protein [Alphaproteobacteria bacterium]|nr:DUF4175 family protein [Alphaproteobacteria bacterium]